MYNNSNLFKQRRKNCLKKKNADYGDAFAKFGLIGVLVRIEDKIKRSLSISKSQIQLIDDEKIEDTLLDLHNYAAMALMLMKEKSSITPIPQTLKGRNK